MNDAHEHFLSSGSDSRKLSAPSFSIAAVYAQKVLSGCSGLEATSTKPRKLKRDLASLGGRYKFAGLPSDKIYFPLHVYSY